MARNERPRKAPSNAAAQGSALVARERREKKAARVKNSSPVARRGPKPNRSLKPLEAPDRRRGLHRAVDLVVDYWIVLLGTAGGVLAGVSKVLTVDAVAKRFVAIDKNGVLQNDSLDWWANVMIVVGLLMVAASQILQARQKTRITSLEKECEGYRKRIEDLEQEKARLTSASRELLDRYLGVLANGQLKFDHNDRISLYVHNGDSEFTRAARYSPNANFKKSGRLSYPDDEGCIGNAWNQRAFFDDDFPDPEIEYEAFIARHVKDGLSEDAARSMSMKSRCLGAYTIMDVGGHASRAVVVVESIEPKRFSKEMLDGLFLNSDAARYLSEFLDIFEEQMPDISSATRGGF